jgi:LuxR family transcriptional regulator, maltose regulon positive regulatory protein
MSGLRPSGDTEGSASGTRRGAARRGDRGLELAAVGEAEGTGPGPPLDVIDSKVRLPVAAAGSVSRVGLVNRLRTTTTVPIVLVTAPAGYGKTTLLAQWAARDERSAAWVTIDDRENDALVLVRHIAVALGGVRTLPPSLLEALRVPGGSVWAQALPRLVAAIGADPAPFILILDGVDRLHSRGALDVVEVVASHVPEGSILAMSGRMAPALPIGQMRLSGRVLEIEADALALSPREAALLLRGAGVDSTEAQVRDLVEQTEGWPAGLVLAARCMRGTNRSREEPLDLAREDRCIADYIRSEHLAHMDPDTLTFLRRSSVLRRMSGPLCDSVLETSGSGSRLREILRSNLFVVPLDAAGRWYRYHHLFRDVLRRELNDLEAERIPGLNERGADWFEAHGDMESALDAAAGCGDVDRVARILATIALPVLSSGRAGSVERWLEDFPGRDHLERYPAVAAVGAWVHTVRGNQEEAHRWLRAAERAAPESRMPDGCLSVRTWTAVVRAAMCEHGAQRMLADAESALADLPADSRLYPIAALVRGAALTLLGQTEEADIVLADAVRAAGWAGAADVQIIALGERAMLAAACGDQGTAEALAEEGRELVYTGRLDTYATSAAGLASAARGGLRRCRWDEARADLQVAERLTGDLGDALPWLAVQTRIELARALLTLRDADGAAAHLDGAREVLKRHPDMGVLGRQADALRDEIARSREAGDFTGSGLTAAELRLLPLLATHLSFREIGARLFLSRNTIKTQAISVYRKLGVSSRSAAVERSAEIGLVDLAAPAGTGGLTATA